MVTAETRALPALRREPRSLEGCFAADLGAGTDLCELCRKAVSSDAAAGSLAWHLSISETKSMKRRARRQRTGMPSRETENRSRRSSSRRLPASSVTASSSSAVVNSTFLVPKTYLSGTAIVTLIMLSAMA
jgi:hypothetical protein